jgi:glycosyltransferase involved in cell wall biosynthesis
VDLRVLLLHNRYQIPGGEDTVVRQETAMLREAGLTVDLLEADNDTIDTIAKKLKTALLVPYSLTARQRVAERIAQFQPNVVHVHNFFPSLTPAVYDACRTARIPVVQTLHNYRLMCANGLLFRQGKVCTECLGRRFPLPAILHGCYRGSRIGSAAVAAMIGGHRLRQTWTRRVTRFVALTEFARGLFNSEMGIPQEQIVVKPNAAADPGQGDRSGGYALYVGRLSAEKGISTLLDAARNGTGLGIALKIAGSGPLEALVAEAQIPGTLEYLGQKNQVEVRRLMQQARVLLIPSLWYEGLPMVVPEAFGTGLPIIASRIGSLQTLVEEGGNGLLAEPGNSAALAKAVRRLITDARLESEMRLGARRTYETLYRPEANIRLLVGIYEQARGTDGLSENAL